MFARPWAPRLPLFVAIAALLVVLSLLATLQYRWVGQVGEAERARLQAGAHERVEQLARDFDREVTRAFAWLQVDADMLAGDGGSRFATRYERWSGLTEHPGLVAAVYVHANGEAPRLRRFDPATRSLVEADWPRDLSRVRDRIEAAAGEPDGEAALHIGGRSPGGADRGAAFRGGFPSMVDEAPALVTPIFDPEPSPQESLGRGGFRLEARGTTIVLLDRAYIERDLLPTLAARYFASGGEFDYCVIVHTRRAPRTVVYRSDPDDGAHPEPDASAGLLDVRLDLLDGGILRGADGNVPLSTRRFFSRDPRRSGPPTGGALMRTPVAPDHGLWEVGVVHRGGSLEQVVARTRRRNLMISFGTLLLLGASAAMIVVSSQRARRLAAQQVEFVAGVSHELRTPVAVVCAAGENLADGIFRDAAEVRAYGAAIRDEGRRLAAMIEQVLEFAGIEARERRRPSERVAVRAVIDEAVTACAGTIAEGAIVVEVDAPPGLPFVLGDRAALRRALQNLIQNSAKHASAGRWIGISAIVGRAGRAEVVRITVRDRGPGISAGEERRIFQAFYRGRAALAAGVSGSGLGLSLVARIAEAHGGTVEVDSAPGAGSAFTLVLPAAAATPGVTVNVEEKRAQADPAR